MVPDRSISIKWLINWHDPQIYHGHYEDTLTILNIYGSKAIVTNVHDGFQRLWRASEEPSMMMVAIHALGIREPIIPMVC